MQIYCLYRMSGCKYTNFFICLLFCAFASAQTRVDGIVVSTDDVVEGNSTSDYISLYQKYLSAHKNGVCAMHPSCSNFGLMVFDKKNFFEAGMLVADRLIRCSHDQKYYNKYNINGKLCLIDYPGCDTLPRCFTNYILPATDELKTHPDSVLLFVNHLINITDFRGALLEINRASFFNKQTDELYSKKLMCYRGINDLETGIYEYEVLFPEYIKKRADVGLEIAKLYYMTDNYKMALSKLANFPLSNEDFRLARNIGLLQALSYTCLGDYDNADKKFKSMACYGDSNETVNRNLGLLNDMKNIKKKSPTVARLLSVVPGLGYLYSGHKGSACTSFIVNSLLMYATYTSIKSDNYGVAGLMGFVSLSFYIGNINGAARSAKRYNERMKYDIKSELEKTNYIFNN